MTLTAFDKLALRRSPASPAPSKPSTPSITAEELLQPRKDYSQHADIRRIVSIPTYRGMDQAEIDAFNKEHILADAYNKGFRFFDEQAESAAAYEMLGGMVGKIPVGRGKTLSALLIASIAYTKGLRKILLLIPSSVVYQLMHIDIKWARVRININYPIHGLGGKSLSARRMLTQSGKTGLYVMPYSQLSGKDASEMIAAIRPELVITDEAHNLAKMSAARSRRIREYMDNWQKYDLQKQPEFIAMSGTITSKSPMDYYHLQKWCLLHNSPMPEAVTLANEWSAIIDAQAGKNGDPSPSMTGALMPLIDWGRINFPNESISEDLAGFRKAFKLRFNSVPGIVCGDASELGTSLVLCNAPIPDFKKHPQWGELEKVGKNVEDLWETPNGDAIEHQIHLWKWLYEIYGAGFYNELTWPTPQVYAERKQIGLAEAEEVLRRCKLHHKAGQEYAKELRPYLKEKSKPGLDTPFLVGGDMLRYGAKNVGNDLYSLWKVWKDLDFAGRPERDGRAVRVCSYKIEAAVAWTKALPKDRGALMWVHHQEVGRWLYDALKASDIDAVHCPAGDQYNKAILDPEKGNKVVVASISAHGTGKNLQHFQEQYFVQWPRPASICEQTLGRTHRSGQLADELLVYTNNTTDFDKMMFAACLIDALYVHQSTGNRQKLIYAVYNPRPAIFPPSVLRERGFENHLLNADQQQMFDEKFSE